VERAQRRHEKELKREEWLIRTGKLTREYFRPTAADEESTRLRVLARKWLDGRRATHKTWGNDVSRWTCHLAPAFGDLEPLQVDVGRIRLFVEERLAAGLVSTTVRNCILLLSSLFTDLVEQGLAPRNPVRAVPRAVKRLYRRAHDPRTTPFLERVEDIVRLRNELREPLRSLFSVAVKSGLRPGELVALHWEDVRSNMRLLHVQRRWRLNKIDTPKSGKGRTVPVSPGLAEILRGLRPAGAACGPIFRPTGRSQYIDLGSLRETWQGAVARAGLAPITFYQATRHTFASQWVLAGRPIEQLSAILGHSSVTVTEVYAHLKPEALAVPDVFSFDHRVNDPKAGAEGSAA
jgi:integrase